MKISKRAKNSVTSTVLVLFSVAGYFYCIDNTLPNEGEIGSMYTPKLLCVCLLVLSVLKLFYALKDDGTPVSITVDRKKLFTGAGTIGLIGLYCFFFKPLGFVIVTFLYLVGQMALFYPGARRHWRKIFCIAFFTTAATYFIFVVAFNLMLPLGPLKNVLIL